MWKLAGVLGICVAMGSLWGDLLADTPDAKPGQETPHEAATEQHVAQIAEEIRQRLLHPVSLQLDHTPLSEALDMLLKAHHFEYWVDSSVIDDAKLKLDEIEVTADLKNVSFRAALKRILSPSKLAWVCEDAGIRITTREEQASTLFARVYDIAPLLETMSDVEVTAPRVPQAAQFGGGGVPIGPQPGQNGMAPVRPRPFQEGLTESARTMLRTIVETTGGTPFGPWVDVDGEGGSVHLIRTKQSQLLVVRQNEATHAQIEDLLNDLISHHHSDEEQEEGAAAKTAAKAPVVRLRLQPVAKRSTR